MPPLQPARRGARRSPARSHPGGRPGNATLPRSLAAGGQQLPSRQRTLPAGAASRHRMQPGCRCWHGPVDLVDAHPEASDVPVALVQQLQSVASRLHLQHTPWGTAAVPPLGGGPGGGGGTPCAGAVVKWWRATHLSAPPSASHRAWPRHMGGGAAAQHSVCCCAGAGGRGRTWDCTVADSCCLLDLCFWSNSVRI